jgi:hypothetical protein
MDFWKTLGWRKGHRKKKIPSVSGKKDIVRMWWLDCSSPLITKEGQLKRS